MNVILAAVNSQYIHSNLAVWQLKACLPSSLSSSVRVKEFSVNQQPKWVYTELLREAPDLLCFSCYLWNISFVLSLCEELHSALPDCKLVLGGPEVSFDSRKLLLLHPYLDAILVGEGEVTLPAVLWLHHQRKSFASLEGVTCLNHGAIQVGTYQVVSHFAALPSPYTKEMLQATKGKILYYEASRGCPFSCSYCLSQLGHGVREKPLEAVKRDLLFLEQQGVTLLKFVDRTFNCKSARAAELWRFAAGHLKQMRLHFEIGADLVNAEQLEALGRFSAGQVQLEAGVQSTNSATLREVCRKMDLERLKENSKAILAFGGIHYHLDLIAGLPHESYQRFGQSFDEIYALRPHQLQLGFLKMLKGTRIRGQATRFSYTYRASPPYEVIGNDCITPRELAMLGCVEEAVERYYNSGRFLLSLPFLLKKFQTPFSFYEALANRLYQKGDLNRSVSAEAQFAQLLDFANAYLSKDELLLLQSKLRLDSLLSGLRGTLPGDPQAVPLLKHWRGWLEDFLRHGGLEELGLPRPGGMREWNQRYRLVAFDQDPFCDDENGKKTLVLMDKAEKEPIYGRYKAYPVLEKYLSNFFTTAKA